MTFGLSLLLLLLASAPLPGRNEEAKALPFSFGLDPDDVARYRRAGRFGGGQGVEMELRLENVSSGRIDLFQNFGSAFPRWKWMDASRVGQGPISLKGSPGAFSILVVRNDEEANYLLEGPFRWASETARRVVHPQAARTLRGTDSVFEKSGRMLFLTAESVPEALCENDGASRWQCLAVPANALGVLAFCSDEGTTAFAEARPQGPPDTALRRALWAARSVVAPAPGSTTDLNGVEIRLLRHGEGGGQFLRNDETFGFLSLGGGHFWFFGSAPIADQVLKVTALDSGASLPLSSVAASGACGEPSRVSLEPTQSIFGTVFEARGEPLPVPSVLLLEKKERGSGQDSEEKPPSVVADVEGDERGRYRITGLQDATYRVRACHGTAGCAEKLARPGPEPLDFRLESRAQFRGRVVSSSGAPEDGATVRIVPTFEQYAGAKQKTDILPLQVQTGADGRFQVSPPGPGQFLLEARSWRSGTARRAIHVEKLSQRVTDLGDIVLPPLGEFAALVAACAGGTLSFSGPMNLQTSLPSLLRFPIGQDGKAFVRLPEGGSWIAWASCGGADKALEPSMLVNVDELFGTEVRFAVVGNLR